MWTLTVCMHAGRKWAMLSKNVEKYVKSACETLINDSLLTFLSFFTQWFPEVKHFCRDIPVILIGCKTDLRKDKECARKLKAMNQAPITYTQVRQSTYVYLLCLEAFCVSLQDVNCSMQEEAPKPELTTTFNCIMVSM